MGPGILPKTTVCKHNPPCRLQMPTKALSAKRKPYLNMVQKSRPVLWVKMKMDCFKVEKNALVRWVQIWHSCWWSAVSSGLKRWCYQPSVLKAAPLMVWRCITSITTTPESQNLDAQTSSNCFEKKRRCYSSYSERAYWNLLNEKIVQFESEIVE